MGDLLTALGITVVIEAAVYLLLLKGKAGWLILYSVIINGITNPLMNAGYAWLTALWYESPPPLLNPVFLCGEALVVLAEIPLIAVLAQCGLKRAAVVSVTANLITASLSFALS